MQKLCVPSSTDSYRQLPIRRIITAIEDAVFRWRNPDFAPRVRVTQPLVKRTGYDPAVVEYALERLFFSIDRTTLEQSIRCELGSLDILDGFVLQNDGTRSLARGVERVGIISSRTTIGVALSSALFALCAKAQVLVKDREDGLIQAFFATLIEEEPRLAPALHAQAWEGKDTKHFQGYDVVIAFGSNEHLQEIRRSLDVTTHFIGHGAKLSCGVLHLTPSLLNSNEHPLFERAARDIVLYDAEGCMSLHVLFCILNEQHDATLLRRFAQRMRTAIEHAGIEFPPGAPSPYRDLRRTQALAALQFAVAQHDVALIEASSQAIVVVDAEQPPIMQPRSLLVVPVRSPAEVSTYMQRFHRYVEAVAYDQDERSVAYALATGATRITAFGFLQDPLLRSGHGGRATIRDFVTIVHDETQAVVE